MCGGTCGPRPRMLVWFRRVFAVYLWPDFGLTFQLRVFVLRRSARRAICNMSCEPCVVVPQEDLFFARAPQVDACASSRLRVCLVAKGSCAFRVCMRVCRLALERARQSFWYSACSNVFGRSLLAFVAVATPTCVAWTCAGW